MAQDQSHHPNTDQIFHFHDHRLDVQTEQLWRGEQAVRLTGKAFAVLAYLVRHPGELVSKDDLFQAVWPDTVVSDATLTSSIKELRKSLRDKAKAPQYIETVHRRGFRFIAPLAALQPDPQLAPHSLGDPPPSVSSVPISPSALPVVGREMELRQLQDWLEKAQAGERQIIFVTGEPGIGKTAVIESFLSQVADHQQVMVGQGQCIEQHGAGEAYLPILEH